MSELWKKSPVLNNKDEYWNFVVENGRGNYSGRGGPKSIKPEKYPCIASMSPHTMYDDATTEENTKFVYLKKKKNRKKMKVRLFRFKSKNATECIYVYSINSTESEIRYCLGNQDSGGGSHEDFAENIDSGKFKEIKKISQVPEENWGYVPYTSYELDPNGFQYTIEDFLEIKEG